MGKTVSLANPGSSGRSWFSNALGGAWKLMKQGIELPSETSSPLYAEVTALASPHLPVLAHKRARYLKSHGALENASWMLELNHFAVRSVCPHLSVRLAGGGFGKKNVIEILDQVVGAEQGRIAKEEAVNSTPYTSRFDTSWAI